MAGTTATHAYFRELGIVKQHRGGIEPVLGIMLEPCRRGRKEGADFGFYWTSKDSRLYSLMIAFGMRVLYEFGDPERTVLLGDTLENGIRRFSAGKAEIMRHITLCSPQTGP